MKDRRARYFDNNEGPITISAELQQQLGLLSDDEKLAALFPKEGPTLKERLSEFADRMEQKDINAWNLLCGNDAPLHLMDAFVLSMEKKYSIIK